MLQSSYREREYGLGGLSVTRLADEPIIAYTVFPELSKPRAVQRLSDAARIV